ncbi:MAG: response regulator transcription factor [Vicinamibacterales bacterium]
MAHDLSLSPDSLRPHDLDTTGSTRALGATPSRVLVVEDEADIAGLIKHALERHGDFTVECVTTGDAALRVINARIPDLVVLDLNLPVMSGFEICRILRGRPHTRHVPLIMVTARAGESDRVSGLDLGADDYIVKPFSPRELAARVRAVLRRRQTPVTADSPVYRGRHLTADFEGVSVSVDGVPISLTRREFELLRYLVQNKQRVVSRERLLERVWGYERVIETRSVDVHIGRLRAKLGAAADQIETVVGLGYRFIEDLQENRAADPLE